MMCVCTISDKYPQSARIIVYTVIARIDKSTLIVLMPGGYSPSAGCWCYTQAAASSSNMQSVSFLCLSFQS